MKRLSKCIAVFLSFTLLFSSFAFTGNAAESDLQADFDNGLMTLTTGLTYSKNGSYMLLSSFDVFSNNTDIENEIFTYQISKYSSVNPEHRFGHMWELFYSDGRVLIPQGESLTFSIHNFYSLFYWGDGIEQEFDPNSFGYLDAEKFTNFFMYFYHFDGTRSVVSKDMYDITFNQDEAYITVRMKADMYDIDVYKIRLFINYDVNSIWIPYYNGWCTSDWFNSYDSISMNYGYYEMFIEISSDDQATTGLFTSIINAVINLRDNVLALPERIKDSLSSLFKGVTDGISNLYYSIAGRGEEGDSDYIPSLWQRIIDGIKGLFVPDEEYMSSYSDKWDTLLSQRLGAVYQVSDVLIGSWQNVTDVDTQKTINIPELQIPLPDNNKFVFGPYDVDIVPDGFGFLFNSIRSITSVCIVVLVFNGLRKKYDEVVNR